MPSFNNLLVYAYLGLALSQSVYATIGPVTDLRVANGNMSPDGFERLGALAEGSFPGPLITGQKDDNFKINLIDNLTDSSMLKSTSIHWHGMFQKGSNWADGPAFVNQCPIATGTSFEYDFSSAGQAGTFWYHSHLSTQYCEGLRGPMVIYDPEDPHLDLYDVDNEQTVITLADYYHPVASTADTFPVADSTIINSAGRFAGGSAVNLTVISVEKGKRYRMRLVSISCDPNYTFSIDQHTMKIIEMDGVNTVPLDVDQLQIFAGQRYSFVLSADQDVDNYWIRANPNTGTTGFSGGINSAILRYIGANDAEPTATDVPTATAPLIEANLVPLESPGAPGTAGDSGVDLALNLNFAFDFTNLQLKINGVAYESPTVPVLLQIMSGAQSATDLLSSGSVYLLPGNSTVQISMPAGVAGGPHPFHLHGHVFDVVRSAGQTTYNYDNPPRRDVVSIGDSGDNVTIRFRTDNAGPWFLHCHIDWHLELGFAVVMAEDVGQVVKDNVPSDAWNNLCPTYNSLSRADL